MLAALLTEINQPLVLSEAIPCDLNTGQVLVKVLVSGICGAQLQEIRGEKGTHFPRFMGHEGCGIVEEIPFGCTKFKCGQKVVMHWRKGSGAESVPPEYYVPRPINGKGTVTSGQVTTFSEYSICSENRLTAVPHDTPNELCSLLGCALSTALGVMENEAQLKAGESVLIVGCGGVGLNLIRVAKMFGASRVVGLDRCDVWEQKVAHVREAGAERLSTPNSLATDLHPTSFDVIVDTTGDPEAIANTIPLLGSAGRFVMIGQPKPGAEIILHAARHMFDGEGKSIRATQGGQFNPEKHIPRYVAMHKSGHLSIDGIVTHRYKLSQVNEALDAVRSGQAGRALLEMHTS